jgi:hypothetical protein
MKRLIANQETLDAIEADKPLDEIKAMWKPALSEFEQRRSGYLLY